MNPNKRFYYIKNLRWDIYDLQIGIINEIAMIQRQILEEEFLIDRDYFELGEFFSSLAGVLKPDEVNAVYETYIELGNAIDYAVKLQTIEPLEKAKVLARKIFKTLSRFPLIETEEGKKQWKAFKKYMD